MVGRLGRSTGRALREASADGARGAQCLKSFYRGAKHDRRPTHIGRFAALRYNYTIVRGGRDAAPRDKTHAGRASSGRSEAASASSDPYSKMEFYRMIPPRVDGCNRSSSRASGVFTLEAHEVNLPTGRPAGPARAPPKLERTSRRSQEGSDGRPERSPLALSWTLSRLTTRIAPPAWLPTTT
ncbi:hypothetical protein LMG27177_07154 [Paraburkholderia fynbosensis]|uniref:Uncharacterized protein n=1 Tax=Paraburkholderia fynbosensis TaxID=1200993 RepID=A0A6J5H491_9BURK|nr:hypothetical protein LMG27177_07154 [Paraburkholderia fynbosensis]